MGAFGCALAAEKGTTACSGDVRDVSKQLKLDKHKPGMYNTSHAYTSGLITDFDSDAPSFAPPFAQGDAAGAKIPSDGLGYFTRTAQHVIHMPTLASTLSNR